MLSMRICVFHNLTGGGSVRVMNSVNKDIVKNGHSVDVYTIAEKGGETWLKVFGAEKRVEVSPPKNLILRILWTIFELPKYHKELAREIDDQHFDIVLIHHDKFTKSPYLLRYIKTPNIYFLHEPPREFSELEVLFSEGIKSFIVNSVRLPIYFIDRINVRYSDKIVSNSEYSKRVLEKYYGVSSIVYYPKIEIEPPSIDQGVRDIVLMVGGLNRIKGHDFVLKSLIKTRIKMKVVIIGDGKDTYIKYLKSFASDKLKLTILSSHISDTELKGFYRRSIMLCIGAYNEPFGMTSVEAQRCGAPVVAVNQGGVPETIKHGITGYISPRNTDRFAEYVRLVYKNSKSMENECISHSMSFTKPFVIDSL